MSILEIFTIEVVLEIYFVPFLDGEVELGFGLGVPFRFVNKLKVYGDRFFMMSIHWSYETALTSIRNGTWSKPMPSSQL